MTSIFVTHDQDEAMTMSDTIYLMKDGVIEQSGNPFELYSNPKSSFAASFIGNYNILSPKMFSKLVGEECKGVNNIVIRPELIEISNVDYEKNQECYYFSGIVVGILPQGNIIRYTIKIKETKLDVDILNNGKDFYKLEQQVFLRVKKDSCISL